MTAGKRKLAMIGIDAGDLEFIRASADHLPNLRQLLDNGAVRSLETTSKFLTGSVWPTFYTGTSPGEHGIYHHLQWDPQAMRIRRVSADWLYAEPFWYRLARAGVKVTVLDVPMTFPTRLSSGIEVINWGSHDQLGRFHANRPGMARAIRRRFGAHPMGLEIPVDKTPGELTSIRDRLVAGARLKGELIRWLLREEDWDFFLTVFGECHRGGHILWPEDEADSAIPPDALLDVYRAVDAAIGAIREDLSGVPVVLFALHGMQRNLSQEHFMPVAIERINAIYAGADIANPDAAAPPSGIMRHLRRSLPAGLQNAVARAVPVWVRDWVVSRATTGGLDWDRTPGFAMLADFNGYLRLNYAGRESKGRLQPGSREQARYVELVQNIFGDLRNDDSNQSLVQNVVPLPEVYPGRRAACLPDWVITWTPSTPAERARSAQLGELTARRDTGRSGNHRHEGFAAAFGPHGFPLERLASIGDFAPRVLEYFECVEP